MTQTKTSFQVRTPNHKSAVIDILGEMNAQAETALMEAYTEANGPGVQAIILNFSGLEYMNSSGIGLLVTLLIRVQRQKQKMLAYGLSAHYREIFSLTRLDSAIGIYPSEAEALAAI
jgi:anti-sigma B factor antagonist